MYLKSKQMPTSWQANTMLVTSPRRIYFDERASDAVASIAEEKEATRILIVTDRVIESTSYFKEVVDELRKSGILVEIFSGVEPEPSFETAKQIGITASRHKAELIVAIGGGSVIDAAKGGYILYEKPDIVLEELNPFEPLKLGGKALLVAIPTTCGTGSDASFGIVLTKIENNIKRKLALAHHEIVPYASILDIRFLETLPSHLVKNTSLDALSHAIEAYVAVTANIYTDAISEKVVETIILELPSALSRRSQSSLKSLHISATMAGIAFTNAGLGLAHAIAHTIGPILGLHHGLAVSIALPYVVGFNAANSSEAEEKYSSLFKKIRAVAQNTSSSKLDEFLREFYKKIQHPLSLREVVEIGREKWESIVNTISEKVLEDPSIAFNPVTVSSEEVKKILLEMY